MTFFVSNYNCLVRIINLLYLFSLLKIFRLKDCNIHCFFNLLIFRIKDEDALPYGDGLIQVARSILFEAIFKKDFLTVPNLFS